MDGLVTLVPIVLGSMAAGIGAGKVLFKNGNRKDESKLSEKIVYKDVCVERHKGIDYKLDAIHDDLKEIKDKM